MQGIDPIRQWTVELDVTTVAPPGASQVTASVFAPPAAEPTAMLWWLLPGGGMSRRYWDLDVAGDETYSLARYLARRGHVAISVDHLGIGDSSRPDDGWSLTPHVLADVNNEAYQQVLAQLRAGTLVDGLDAVEPTLRVGCGHSMGAGLAVYQQARHRCHDALCLLGYGGRGLPEHLRPEEARYADDPDALHDNLVSLIRSRYDDPYPVLRRGSSTMLVGAGMPDSVRAALVAARTNLLALAGHASMIPGNAAREIARIDVPTFIAHGDRDIGVALHEIAADFNNCPDLTLFLLPDSGHNHNVSPNRVHLWHRMLVWSHGVSVVTS